MARGAGKANGSRTPPAPAGAQDGMYPDPDAKPGKSRWCEPCSVEVYGRRAHCGKTRGERT